MYFDYSEAKSHKLYYFIVPPLRVLSHIVYYSRCYGRENIPKSGKLIIACNHVAFSDPALIIVNCPRRVHYMAKSELFRNPFLARIFTHMNAFPVKRATSDRQALRFAKELLDKDEALGIFPEGRRVRSSSNSMQARAGVGYLARISGADVLPCCILKQPGFIRSRAVVSFGRVIKNSELGFKGIDKSAETKKASEYIMKKIEELWEEEKCRSK